MPSADANPQPQSETDESTFNATDIASAILLAATGGLTDAVVYMDHGHVFANAMTGNFIFLGMSAVTGDWMQVLRHTVPIAAFFCGVFAARLIRTSPIRHSAMVVLAVETVAFFFVGFIPGWFPQLAYTAIVALVSAFQVTTFRRVGRFTYNSTFVTGNMREVAEGLFDRTLARDPELRRKGTAQASKLAAICLSFLAGAIVGAFVAPRYPAHAILFAEPLLIAALILTIFGPQPVSEAAPRTR